MDGVQPLPPHSNVYFVLISKILLSALFSISGVYHFANPHFYTRIIPQWVPYKLWCVYITGVWELVAAILLFTHFIPGAINILAMLIVFMIVHVGHVFDQEMRERVKVTRSIALVRLVIQFVLIGWVVALIKM